MNDIETLLERICKKTYLNESGWEIVRNQGRYNCPELAKSTCEFKKGNFQFETFQKTILVFLNENFVFTRPLTVTGVILFQNEMNPHFHQMTLDRIENGEYVLQNTQFSVEHPAAIRIEQTRPYFHPSYEFVNNLCIQTQNNIYVEGNIKLRFVNQNRLMRYNKWYLCPQAYSLTLTKVLLNKNFIFSHGMTVFGAILFNNKTETKFYKMQLKGIENGEYVLDNWSYYENHQPEEIRIKQTHPYYSSSEKVEDLYKQTGKYIFKDENVEMELVNENFNMKTDTWYLRPESE
ncbi:unnamed protein product [Oikopleura dioica]|uniref:Uncharacterized protein n=1 Tax=Oikopleura dioica TaxID=34765 RepID=E4XUR1_OIKDI|nr:unnamed protein product [Oikopleura dioica]